MDQSNGHNNNNNDDNDNPKNALYYSPRILPDHDLTNNDDDDSKQDKSDKYIERFIHSIVRQEKDKFNQLLSFIDLNTKSANNSWTPLIWAIQKDRIWAIKQMFNTTQIIDFSKQIDKKLKRTVLHFAAEKGDIPLVKLLIDKDKQQQNDFQNNQIKLDINARDREDSTALFRAAKVGEADIVKLLLQNGADPNIRNRDGIQYTLYPRTQLIN